VKRDRKAPKSRPYPSQHRALLSTTERPQNSEQSSLSRTNDVQTHATHDIDRSTEAKHVASHTSNYPSYIRRLTSSLPPLHRPTRDEMLALATNFWERMKIRFKWFTIRGFRRFDTDDISAFLSWFVLSQAIWIMVGTSVFRLLSKPYLTPES
jgi:mitochondrial distribution and morphology protein 31